MPGIDLMELLGEISKRTQVSYLATQSLHETSFTSVGTLNTVSMATSQQTSMSRLGIHGVHRKRVHRLRKPVPYIGGAPFMGSSSSSQRARAPRTSSSSSAR